MKRVKRPCRECPFRKDSAPGYLGELSYKPEAFLMMLDDEIPPCHLTINWEKRDFSKADTCSGAMQFMNNHGKLSRKSIVASVQEFFGKNKKVFQFRHEFIEHHTKKEIDELQK